jgi:hypothetical protein
VAPRRTAHLVGSYRQLAFGIRVAAPSRGGMPLSSPPRVANRQMPRISNRRRQFRNLPGPVVISIRRIGPGEVERVFAYSGVEGARTVKRVLEQACRLVAGLPGVCEIEILTMDRSDPTGRRPDVPPRGKPKSRSRPLRSGTALDCGGRKLLAEADEFDQPHLQRPRHRAAR